MEMGEKMENNNETINESNQGYLESNESGSDGDSFESDESGSDCENEYNFVKVENKLQSVKCVNWQMLKETDVVCIKDQGFYRYVNKYKYWKIIRLSDQKAENFLAKRIQNSKTFQDYWADNDKIKDLVDRIGYWRATLDWARISDSIRAHPRSSSLITFQNVTLDVSNLSNLPHNKDLHSLNYIPTNYEKTFPPKESLDFLYYLASKDTAKLQLFRAMFKTALVRNNKYKMAFYLVGQNENEKTAFVHFLKNLLPTTSRVLPLSIWKTPFDRLQAFGSDILIFDDITPQCLTLKLVSALKAYIKKGKMEVSLKKGELFSMTGKGVLFFLSKSIWNQKKLNLDQDLVWKEKILYIPILSDPTSNNQLKLSKNIIKNMGSIMNWSLAFSDSLLEEIANNISSLNEFFEEHSDSKRGRIIYFFNEWFFTTLRVNLENDQNSDKSDTSKSAESEKSKGKKKFKWGDKSGAFVTPWVHRVFKNNKDRYTLFFIVSIYGKAPR